MKIPMAIILFAPLLTACGGGSGSGGSPPPQPTPQSNHWDEMRWDQGSWE